MKKSLAIVLTFLLFMLMCAALVVTLIANGYATGVHPDNELLYLTGFFVANLLLIPVLLYLLKAIKKSFFIICYAETILLYVIVYFVYY